MSDDFDLDSWGDDPFDGDLSFDSDFDGKSKGFLSSVGTGFLSGLKDGTYGSTEGRLNMARMALPRSYGRLFDYGRELQYKKRDIVDELKNSSATAVTDLQSIGTSLLDRFQDKVPNKIAERIKGFTETDFSDWETRDYSSASNNNGMEETTEEDVQALTLAAISSQTNATVNLGKIFTKTMAEFGGRQIGQMSVGNQLSGSIDTTLKGLLNYQRKVQAKNDAAKINLLSRIYLTNAKFYKFMEAGIHRQIDELKSINKNSGMSDYQKTSHFQAVKGTLRQSVITKMTNFGGVGAWARGLMGQGKDSIENASGVTGQLASMLQMTDGLPINWGEEIGRGLAGMMINNIPRMVGSGKGRDLTAALIRQFPSQARYIRSLNRKLDRIGSIASYGVTNGAGVVNRAIADNWNYQDDFTSYEEYVSQLPQGQRPMSRARFRIQQAGKNFLGNRLNNVAWNINASQGARFNLQSRNLKDLAENSIWTRQSDRTLNEVIPEWLSKQHLALEQIRSALASRGFVSGNVEQQRYDYRSGKMITLSNTKNSVNKTLFGNAQFQGFARYSDDIAGSIDEDNQLSSGARKALAYRLARDADNRNGFNPFSYLNLQGEEGISDRHAGEINALIRRRFGLSDAEVERGNEDPYAALRGLRDRRGQRLMTDVADATNRLRTYTPDISNQIDLLRNAGNDDVLSEMGIITTVNGMDQFNMDAYWRAFRNQLENGSSPNNNTGGNNNPVPPGAKPAGRFGGLFNWLNPNNAGPTPFAGPNAAPSITGAGSSTNYGDVSGLAASMDALRKSMESNVGSGNINLKPVTDRQDSAHKLLSGLTDIAKDQLKAIQNIRVGKTTPEDKTAEGKPTPEKQRRNQIIDKLKGIPGKMSDLLKGGLDKLLSNEPLMMGGFLGGLAGLISHSPSLAIAAGLGGAAWGMYRRAANSLSADAASDDEDIYTDDSPEPVLEARKLKAGQYWDNISKKVITSWSQIKGAVTDLVTKVVVSAKTLAGKLFGSDGRRVIIKGLSAIKDFASSVFKAVDPLGKFKRLGQAGQNALYQMDVYRNGDKEPVLTRRGFKAGEYFKRADNELIPLTGWNQIDGAVYDKDGETLLTDMDYQNGLVTSGGLKINSLKTGAQSLGRSLYSKMTGLGQRINPAMNRAKEMIKSDYTPITDRLDLIYAVLCNKFGVKPNRGDSLTPGQGQTKGKLKTAAQAVSEAFVNDEVNGPSQGTRLNSLADRAEKAKEERQAKYEESVTEIAESLKSKKDGEDKGKEKPEKEGMMSGIMNFLKNPFGVVGGFKTLFSLATGFFRVGLKALPLMVSGLGLIGKLMMASIRGAGKIGGGLGNLLGLGGKAGKLGKLASLGKIAKGAGLIGAVSLGTDLVKNAFDISDDSTTGKILNGVSTAGTVVGGAQMAMGAASMLGFNASLGGVVSAAGAGASAMGTGIAAAAPLLFNPITLTVGAVALGGWLIYKHYSKGKGAQYGLRMAQYGIKDPDSELAMKVRSIEEQLRDYVVISGGKAAFAAVTPLEKIFQGIAPDPHDEVATRNFYGWFNLRFKPVYLSYCSALDTAGFKTFEQFDKSTEPRILSICSDINSAMGSVQPYPYMISQPFDKVTPLMNRDDTIRTITGYMNELKTYNERHDRTSGGLVKDGLVTMQTEKERVAASDKASFWQRTKMRLNGTYESSDDLKEINSKFPVQKAVEQIDISDLIPGGDKPLDFITALRLAAYGNMDNVPWRCEAVLRMERYCEDYIQMFGNDPKFTSSTGEIYNLFKNSFRITDSDSEAWLVWFRDRFLPVCMAWVKFVYLNRKAKPKAGWMSMSMTSRYNFGKELVDLKSQVNGNPKSIWDVFQSPFPKPSVSASFNDKARAFLQNLQTMATQAKLKDPVGEAQRTNAAEVVKNQQVRSMGQNGLDKKVALSDAPGGVVAPGLPTVNMKPITGNTDTSMVDLSGTKSLAAQAYTGGSLTPSNDQGVSVPKKAAIQLIMKSLVAAGFTDPRMIAGMLANLDFESVGFQHTAENMKYSPGNLLATFRGRVKDMATATALVKAGPQAIANAVYGGRLGNTGPNDGWLYRGRGFIQLTGKDNYARAGKDLNLDLVNHPEMVSNDPAVAAKTAVWFLKQSKKLQSLPTNGFDYATSAINPALLGIDRRRQLYNQYLQQIESKQLVLDNKPSDDSKTDWSKAGENAAPGLAPSSSGASIPTPSIPSTSAVPGSNNPAPAPKPVAPAPAPTPVQPENRPISGGGGSDQRAQPSFATPAPTRNNTPDKPTTLEQLTAQQNVLLQALLEQSRQNSKTNPKVSTS